jgi:hypothetical protein
MRFLNKLSVHSDQDLCMCRVNDDQFMTGRQDLGPGFLHQSALSNVERKQYLAKQSITRLRIIA